MAQRLVAINNWRKRLADFKFREDEILTKVSNHIIKTYDAHYSMNKIQSTEFIVDAGHGEGFCIGNIIKYRVEAKTGTSTRNRKRVG